MKEITFNADCEICGTKDTPCRNHHLIPQRLLNVLPMNRKKRLEHMKMRACNKCNGYLHPENKLYERIEVLEKKVKEYYKEE
ncbi:MAG: hypothetical protein AABW88_03280 [Nanoarchaeota archaeon]